MRLTDLSTVPYRAIPRVLSVVGPADICNVWRTWWPSGLLGLKGFIADFCTYEELGGRTPLIEAGRYNMIITPRISFKNQVVLDNWCQRIEPHGLTWVYDADDDLFSPEYTDIQYGLKDVLGLEREQAEQQRVDRIKGLQRAHAVTVSSPGLAEVAMRLTPQTVYLHPNYINLSTFRYGMTLKPRIVQGTTIGWSGTLRDEADLIPVARAWRQISREFPDVQFVVQGYESNALCSAVPASRLKVIPGVSVAEYPAALKNIDILCCSVANTPWNSRKTPIKWMEGSLSGAACVVSKALYGDTVEDGRTGLVACTDGDWLPLLSSLITSPERRKTLQQQAVVAVERDHSLEGHWQNVVLTWATILDERFRLNSGRLPTYAKAAD